MYKTFEKTKVHYLNQPLFLGETPDVARYDKQRYPIFEKLTQKQLSFFWRPEEVDLQQDQKDFKSLTDSEKHIFISNLKYQILLDSVQGRGPNMALLPLVSDPSLETFIETWSFSETIHSRSYTHIIRNIFSNPAEIFDNITNISEIQQRADTVTACYDDLIECAMLYKLYGYGSHIDSNGHVVELTRDILIKKLYLCLISMNILEGLRFYVSFACSWAFSELKRMEGNSKIIELIARDENIHLAATQNIIKILKNDPENKSVIESCEDEVYSMYKSAVEQEADWAKYLFKDGSMIGLNEKLLTNYIEYMANKRLRTIGYKQLYKQPHNPLNWTNYYMSSSEKQVAPQETEITSYVAGGGIQPDLNEDTFSGFDF